MSRNDPQIYDQSNHKLFLFVPFRMLRVANLCSELTCRNGILTAFWQNATKALFNRNQEPKEKVMFNELLAKINVCR